MVIKAAGAEARIAKGELGAFAEDAAKMAIAFNLPAEAAGEQMAAWRTSFGLSQDGVRALSDQINALTNKMGGNTAAISETITRIGPLGQVAGLAGGQIAAMAATLDAVKVPSDVAGTGIKNMLLAMTKGAAATKAQSEAFKRLGFSTTDLAKRMQTDASGAITDVLTRISQLKGEDQTSILTELFGSESVTAIAPMLTNLDDLKKRLELVGDASAYTGSMAEEFLARMGTTSAKLQIASNRVEVMKVKLGDRLLPLIVEAADRVGALADRISAWADRNPKLANTLMIIASVLGPLLIGLGALGIVAGTVGRGWAVLSFGFTKLKPLLPLLKAGFGGVATGIRLVGAAIMANPILAIIALLAGAVYLIYRNWDTIGPWVKGLWNKVTAFFQSGIDNILSTLADFSPLGILYQGFAKLLNWLGIDIPDKLSTVGKNLLSGLWNGLWSQKDWLVGKLKLLANLIPEPIRKALGIKSPSRVFMRIGGDIMDGLDEGLEANARNPVSRVRGLSGQLTRAMAVGITAPALMAANPAAASSDQLAQALARGTPTPTQRAVAVPPATTAAAAPARFPAAGATPASVNTYNLTINVTGSNPVDVERAVRSAIERIERDRSGRTFSDNR